MLPIKFHFQINANRFYSTGTIAFFVLCVFVIMFVLNVLLFGLLGLLLSWLINSTQLIQRTILWWQVSISLVILWIVISTIRSFWK